MRMNRTARFIMALAIIAIVFSVIAFAVPFHHTLSFWIAYFAEMIAIVLQYPVFHSAFSGETSQSKVYGMPIARIGILYLGIQTILSLALFVFGFVSAFPNWIGVVACMIVLGFSLLGVIGTDIAREQIQKIDAKSAASTSEMEQLRFVTSALPSMTQNADLKKSLTALAEEFKFSDPVSSPATESIEKEISDMVVAVQLHLKNDSATADEIRAVSDKLSQRNVMCKNAKAI